MSTGYAPIPPQWDDEGKRNAIAGIIALVIFVIAAGLLIPQ
jgi:hypothetical protein